MATATQREKQTDNQLVDRLSYAWQRSRQNSPVRGLIQEAMKHVWDDKSDAAWAAIIQALTATRQEDVTEILAEVCVTLYPLRGLRASSDDRINN